MGQALHNNETLARDKDKEPYDLFWLQRPIPMENIDELAEFDGELPLILDMRGKKLSKKELLKEDRRLEPDLKGLKD